MQRATAGASGICMEWDILDPKFPIDTARAGIEEIKSNQKYWQGDFYPLTSYSFNTDVWLAWQLDRPDLHEGMALVFPARQLPAPRCSLTSAGSSPRRRLRCNSSTINEKSRRTPCSAEICANGTEAAAAQESSMLIRYKMQ